MDSTTWKPDSALLLPRGIPILLYHRVGPAVPGTYENLTIPPQQFVEHMDWLETHGYQGVGLAALFDAARTNSPARKTVVLTFDDGYESLMSHALPVFSVGAKRL